MDPLIKRKFPGGRFASQDVKKALIFLAYPLMISPSGKHIRSSVSAFLLPISFPARRPTMPKLTNDSPRRLALPDGRSDVIHWDDDLKGFGLRIRAGGKRAWIVQFRNKLNKTERKTLGSTAQLTAFQARQMANELLAETRIQVQNVQHVRVGKQRRRGPTLGELADRWLVEVVEPTRRPATSREYRRHLTTDWKPLRDVPIEELSKRLVAEVLRDMDPQRRCGNSRARATLSAFCSWAVHQDYLDLNPVIGTSDPLKGFPSQRDRRLTDGEVREVWHAAGNEEFGRIVRLLILTGQRRDEVGGMRWSELDLADRLWRIPGARTKNRLQHAVPLTSAALELIQAVPARNDRDLVFGMRIGGFSGYSKAKKLLDARILRARQETLAKAGLDDAGAAPMAEWRLHDLRRTVVSGMSRLRVPFDVRERFVNHVSGPSRAGIAGVYDVEELLDERRKAAERWADHVLGLVNDLLTQAA
ncbi:MAG: tyrosine-type recombinase/integrase [Pseudomonadota bacterium]